MGFSAVFALGAVACGGGDNGDSGSSDESSQPTQGSGGNAASGDPSRFALQPSDLPVGYTNRSGYPRSSTSAQECLATRTEEGMAAAGQIQSTGLKSCYAVVYTKSAGQNTNNPGSQSYLFRDPATAGRALPLVRQALLSSLQTRGAASSQAPTDFPVSGVGEETAPGIRATIIPGKYLRFYFWRTGNVVVVLGGSDALDDATEQSFTDLARKIDARGKQ